MSVKFKVKMTEEYMYDFMMYHNYTHPSGILGAVVGVAAAGLAVRSLIVGDNQTAMLGILFAILFLVVTPKTTRSRAKMQVEKTKMFQEPLEYELNEHGITVRQGELEATNPWDEFAKVVCTRKSLILYITRVRALIFPKACMGEQYEAVVDAIRNNLPKSKVKIRPVKK